MEGIASSSSGAEDATTIHSIADAPLTDDRLGCSESLESSTSVRADSDTSDKLSGENTIGDDCDELFCPGGSPFKELLTKNQQADRSSTSSSSSKTSESSLFSSAETSYSSTRRNSLTNSVPDLGTPLNFLFHSSSRASPASNGSHTDTPHDRTVSADEADIVSGLDRLLNRITSERFLELRRIQLGERPVTGGNARTSLENFFQRALHGPTEEQRTAEEESNRPENVANDVQSLLQLSRVRSALQSGFTTRLESTLSFRAQPNSVTQQPRNNFRQQRQQHQQRQNNNSSQLRHNNVALRAGPPTNAGVPLPPPLPPTGRSIPVNPPTIQEMSHHSTPTSRPSALQSTVDASVEMLAESIATDITRLQSLQVVSTMLRTDFRSELEHLVQQRVEETGNGAAVAEIIRSLPRNTRPPQHTRATAHQPSSALHPYIASNDSRQVSEEMRQLRHQLDEMKRMMAMSMEMQMDTQRAIRQEVAAVFTAFMQDYLRPSGVGGDSQTHGQPTASYESPSTPIGAGQCVICIDHTVDTVLYQCGHMCVCHQCGLQLKMEGHKCPMCRAPIRDIIRAYKSQESTN